MNYELNDKPVEITDTMIVDGMAIVIEAFYIDGDALTEAEMIELEDKYQEELAQDAYERSIDSAHDSMDLER